MTGAITARNTRRRAIRQRNEWPTIRKVDGRWYAVPGRGQRQAVNLLLVPAITYCRKLNAKLDGGAA